MKQSIDIRIEWDDVGNKEINPIQHIKKSIDDYFLLISTEYSIRELPCVEEKVEKGKR